MGVVGERFWGMMCVRTQVEEVIRYLRHCEQAPSHANRADTICRPEDVVMANNNVHHAGGKLAIILGSKSKHVQSENGTSPHQSSSLILCFFFSCTNSSSLRANSALAAAASCFAGMWYNTTIYRSCK